MLTRVMALDVCNLIMMNIYMVSQDVSIERFSNEVKKLKQSSCLTCTQFKICILFYHSVL